MIILKSKDDEISHLVATPLLTIQKNYRFLFKVVQLFFCAAPSSPLRRRNKKKTKIFFKLLNV